MSRWRYLAGMLWRIAGGVSLRTKIMGIVVGVVLLFGLGATTLVHHSLQESLRQQLEKRAFTVARDLALRSTDPLLVNDVFLLHGMVRDTVENNADVRYAFIQDRTGDVVVHSFGSGFPRGLAAANGPDDQMQAHLRILRSEEGLVWDIAAPILKGKAGTARVGLTEQDLQKSVAVMTRRLLLITAAASVLGLLSAVLLTWVLTRPILNLEEVTRAVARGNLAVRATVWAQDEIGRLSSAFNAMIDDLQRAEQRNEEAKQELIRKEQSRSRLLTKVITAQEEERQRIARELHDQTGQALTSLLIGLKVAEASNSLEGAQERVRQMRDVAAQTLQDVQTLAWELRPSLLDDLGLAAALERYAALYHKHYGLDVDLQVTGFGYEDRLPTEVEVTLYRIIQEALTNVARHAQARAVSIVLERTLTEVVAVVEDDGRGFDAERVLRADDVRSRLGLYGMQERASLVGGTVLVESRPGQGTTVRVGIPLDGVVAYSPRGHT